MGAKETDDNAPAALSFTLLNAMSRVRMGSPVLTGGDPAIELRYAYDACRHDKGTLIVDERARTINCGGCNAIIDPFDAVCILARSERHIQKQVDELMMERKRQRGFYALKKTVKAKNCRHKHTYNCGNGLRKCAICDTMIEGEPPAPLHPHPKGPVT